MILVYVRSQIYQADLVVIDLNPLSFLRYLNSDLLAITIQVRLTIRSKYALNPQQDYFVNNFIKIYMPCPILLDLIVLVLFIQHQKFPLLSEYKIKVII